MTGMFISAVACFRSDGIDTNDMFCLAIANFGSSRNYCPRCSCTCLSNIVPIGWAVAEAAALCILQVLVPANHWGCGGFARPSLESPLSELYID